jgi:hypothetical protein
MGSGEPFLQSTIEQSHAPVGSAVRQFTTAFLKSLALVNCEAPSTLPIRAHHACVATPKNATHVDDDDARALFDQCLRRFRPVVGIGIVGIVVVVKTCVQPTDRPTDRFVKPW